MMGSLSLRDIANRARFETFHSRDANALRLMGAVVSDKYDSLYFNMWPEKSLEREVEIFAVGMPDDDMNACALFRIPRATIDKDLGGNGTCNPARGGVNLDKEEPIFAGPRAVYVLLSYIQQIERRSEEHSSGG